ncbi:MAG: hypothetical protein JXA33_15680 [Anaerolineae bacterium]|nr:hypothetical protein [Anaerolineae bacterium]
MKRKPLSGMAWALIAANVYFLTYMGLYSAMPSETDQYLLSVVAAILVATFTVAASGLAWYKASITEKPIWLGIWTGQILWMIAEILWAYLDMMLETGVPDVSIADGFWLLGYPPMIAALVMYLVRARAKLTWKKILVAIGGGVIVPLVFFLAFFLPEFENVSGIASLVYALYPALDILLATGGFLILATFKPKRAWGCWHLISIAQIFMAYADTWYWLLSSINVYGVNMTINFNTTFMVDIPDMLSSVLLGVGCLIAARQSCKVGVEET